MYTRPPWTQHLLVSGLLAASLALGSTSFFARCWARVVTAGPEWLLVIGGTWLIHIVEFWLLVGLFGYVDRNNKPAFIARYRIQDGPRRQPEASKVLKVLAVNQLICAPVMLCLMYGVLKLRGWSLSPKLPGLWEALASLAGMTVLSVLFFYASHRFLHRKWWMSRVHRLHHEFRTTSAWASEYAHWVEMCVGNFGTLAIGVVVLAPSGAVILLYTVLSILTILVHHSGYALPWAPWSVHHDWHHYRMKEAFGTFGVLDRLLGTHPEFLTLKDGERR